MLEVPVVQKGIYADAYVTAPESLTFMAENRSPLPLRSTPIWIPLRRVDSDWCTVVDNGDGDNGDLHRIRRQYGGPHGRNHRHGRHADTSEARTVIPVTQLRKDVLLPLRQRRLVPDPREVGSDDQTFRPGVCGQRLCQERTFLGLHYRRRYLPPRRRRQSLGSRNRP
ncbi:MAG: hypothetical protein ACLRM8_06345 [Alistipes sp.]